MPGSGYHDASFTDLDNLIHSLARHWSKRIGLSWDNHGQDLAQTGWLAAARANKQYEPRGFKFITYAYLSISRDIRRAATRIANDRNTLTVLDTAHDHGTTTADPDTTILLRELLATPAGLELLARELGHTTTVTAADIDTLRARYQDVA